MPANQDYITLCYDNYPDQREYVFAIKGRPFSMLSTQRMPVPNISLIDYNLVRDLGLKMNDLQCSKFTFGGQKFRILGKISQTVQTINNGVISGTVHLRANVVENLSTTFDSHSIAGKKMTDLLNNKLRTRSTSPDSSATGEFGGISTPKLSIPTSVETSSPSPPSSQAIKACKSKPPLYSPKPFNKHWSNTYSAPQEKEDASDGIPRRTLSIKPDDQHIYGRVMSVKHRNGPGEVQVDYMKDNGKIFSLNTIQPFHVHQNLEVNDPVLLKRYDCPRKAEKGGHNDKNPILLVYNSGEETQLRSMGVTFPDCPPNILPGGYYG